MSIATEISRLQGAKADIKTAIEGKGVPVPSSALLDSYPDYIDAIQQGGGGAVEENDVIFIDYDGTILYSYSAAEFANLTELPANPTHEGLTAQGWNWTLADAQAYVADAGGIVIGQTYVTADGKTRLYVSFKDSLRTSVSLCFNQTISRGVTINWGDGSAEETATGGKAILNHTYATSGDYVISLAVTQGTMTLGNGSYNIMRSQASQIFLKAVEIGNNVTGFLTNALTSCQSLETITIPNGITQIGRATFQYCYTLKAAVIPSGATALFFYAVNRCYSAKYVSLPKSVTTIEGYAFAEDASLRAMSIPPITTLDNYVFNNCRSVKYFYAPSTLEQMNTYTLSGCSCIKTPLSFPNVTTIADSVFMGLDNVPSLSLPALSGSAPSSCFRQLSSITEFTIASGVTEIGAYAFLNTANMKALHLKPTAPPTLASNALQGTASDLVIYVPQGTLAAYQGATNWSTYASKMVEEI